MHKNDIRKNNNGAALHIESAVSLSFCRDLPAVLLSTSQYLAPNTSRIHAVPSIRLLFNILLSQPFVFISCQIFNIFIPNHITFQNPKVSA